MTFLGENDWKASPNPLPSQGQPNSTILPCLGRRKIGKYIYVCEVWWMYHQGQDWSIVWDEGQVVCHYGAGVSQGVRAVLLASGVPMESGASYCGVEAFQGEKGILELLGG